MKKDLIQIPCILTAPAKTKISHIGKVMCELNKIGWSMNFRFVPRELPPGPAKGKRVARAKQGEGRVP